MGAPAAPQILITIAARFGRVSWKYSSLAYALILKEVGALMQTFYVMATDMGLGGCAIGTTNIELFAKMTGLQFHVEGPVGQFALGRGAKPEALLCHSYGLRARPALLGYKQTRGGRIVRSGRPEIADRFGAACPCQRE